MDTFAIESTTAGTRVEMTKRLPRRGNVVDGARRPGALQVAGQLAHDPSQEIRRLQRDVIERDARLVELAEELTETNRGVMALHAELEARAEYQRNVARAADPHRVRDGSRAAGPRCTRSRRSRGS